MVIIWHSSEGMLKDGTVATIVVPWVCAFLSLDFPEIHSLCSDNHITYLTPVAGEEKILSVKKNGGISG